MDVGYQSGGVVRRAHGEFAVVRVWHHHPVLIDHRPSMFARSELHPLRSGGTRCVQGCRGDRMHRRSEPDPAGRNRGNTRSPRRGRQQHFARRASERRHATRWFFSDVESERRHEVRRHEQTGLQRSGETIGMERSDEVFRVRDSEARSVQSGASSLLPSGNQPLESRRIAGGDRECARQFHRNGSCGSTRSVISIARRFSGLGAWSIH